MTEANTRRAMPHPGTPFPLLLFPPPLAGLVVVGYGVVVRSEVGVVVVSEVVVLVGSGVVVGTDCVVGIVVVVVVGIGVVIVVVIWGCSRD